MRRTPHLLLVTAVVAGFLMAGTGPVGAGVTAGLVLEVDVAQPANREVPTFSYTVELPNPECGTNLVLEVVDEGDNPVDATIDEDTIVIGPDVESGFYLVRASCTSAGGQQTFEDDDEIAFARGFVEKVVEGEAPAGATFAVEVECEGEGESEGPFTVDFEFPAEGGVDGFIVYDGQTCVVTETATGGADDVEVSGDFGFPGPTDETVTVTNTFGAPTEPESETEPPAALPAEVVPTFTG